MRRALGVWIAATRPRTLSAAVAPVMIGTAIAHRDGAFQSGWALLTLAGALLIQIGTNFANDYFDAVKGADASVRLGPTRATASGLVSPRAMRWAFITTFLISLPVAACLVVRGGWPILSIGAASIAAGVLYTGGPRPLGYLGLGEVLVLVFFGPIAVAGTHYVQALEWSPSAVLAGVAPGLISTALLVVNNLRDTETDRRAGKATLAVRFGRRFAKIEFTSAIAGAALVPVLLWLVRDAPATVMLATLATVSAIGAVRHVVRSRPGDRLLHPLVATGRLLVVFSVAFALGYLV